MLTHKRSMVLGIALLAALPALLLLAASWAETGFISPFALSSSGLDGFIVKLRLYRALCAAGVGGSLALSGAMAQGLFRNPLADPGLLGVSGGAGLGAMIAIALLGGHGVSVFNAIGAGGVSTDFISALGLMAIPVMAMLGAMLAVSIVYYWSVKQGQLSIAMILLAGLALNSLAGAAMAALQTLLLDDLQITRAIVSWGFGTLDDRGAAHALIVWIGALFALGMIPFVGLELDMLASGDSDAEALGADTRKIKLLALASIAISTATAVAVCGQIAFVGLLVPHLVRRLARPRHRSLMLLSFLTGATLLVLVVVVQNGLLPEFAKHLESQGSGTFSKAIRRLSTLQPGVTTSLFGAPFFLVLLMRQKRRW